MIRLNNLTREELVNLYKNEKKSLEDIAKLYNVSRTAIYKRLKKYGLKQRSKSEARLEAQKQGKLPQQFFDINKNFFSSWSPEMAYVYGHKDSKKLFTILYKNTENELFLERKYKSFLEGLRGELLYGEGIGRLV